MLLRAYFLFKIFEAVSLGTLNTFKYTTCSLCACANVIKITFLVPCNIWQADSVYITNVNPFWTLYTYFSETCCHSVNFKDIIWYRNIIVAPISEELTFRACLIPLLSQCFKPSVVVLICPVFFGAGKIFIILFCDIELKVIKNKKLTYFHKL